MAITAAGIAAAVIVDSSEGHSRPSQVMGLPTYDQQDRLLVPTNYREWVFLSAGLDMSYSAVSAAPTSHIFDNVFAAPAAYRAFMATGVWPERTILIVEERAGISRGSINKAGNFQSGAPLIIEAHVKDSTRYKGGWGFFVFDGGKPATQVGHDAACYACHRANAAADTTFVQFYPTLLPIAERRGTLSRSYRIAAARDLR